ncbi:hypothetical protein GCM10010389_59430 [Streptomyces echinoruber]|uniref:Uncharacterized protein n=1 Tax=Streptomyces echinoruber TaxID=68898 RepID=A0A918VP22_9ACTN|nr:hypothetical protein GCM10010389_59430 [Streptomyces echinoruber]
MTWITSPGAMVRLRDVIRQGSRSSSGFLPEVTAPRADRFNRRGAFPKSPAESHC